MFLKGTRKRSAEQIAETMESAGGSINCFSSNHTFDISTETPRGDLDRALDVLANVFLNLSFHEPALERERVAQWADILAENDTVLRAASNLLRAALFAQPPYRFSPAGRASTGTQFMRNDLVTFRNRHVVAST